jgi:hypothetical protein
MIARIIIPDVKPVAVILNDDLTWECPDFPPAAATLNTRHAGTFTEWNGTPGYWQANDAAELFGGRIEYLTPAD